MPRAIKVLAGDVYGMLTIVEEVEKAQKRRRFLCKCLCGSYKEVDLLKLRNGNTKSCGCYQRKVRGSYSVTHGQSGTRIYSIWDGMKDRCLNEKSNVYQHYGGRGISICEEWKDFEIFLSWATDSGYQEDLTLERINNEKGYYPDNCKWATQKEQSNNTRRSIHIEYQGEKKTLKEWSEALGIKYLPLYKRLKRGWSVERAFNSPLSDGDSDD